MAISPGRVAIVVIGLAGIGFICGAFLGAVVSLLESGLSTEHLAGVLGFGAIFGAPIGALITPLVGFVFARRAPLWRAILVGAAGALLGAVAVMPFELMGIFGALPGFLLAMTALYIGTRRRIDDVERAA
jgi:hypothetical protein